MNKVRDESIDVAKGLAIIAIVLGHVLRGMDSAGIIAEPEVVDRALYMFHLSVFAFLSALFVQGSADRIGHHAYARTRVTTFLYLYVVWMLIQGAVKLVTASLVNTPTSLSDVLSLWAPDGQLWFLPWIALMTVLVLAMRPWEAGWRRWVGLGAAAAVSIACWGLNGDYVFTAGLGLTAFYFVGASIGASRLLRALRATTRFVAMAVGLAAGALMLALVTLTQATPPASSGEGRTALAVALGVVAATSGLIAVLWISRAISGRSTAWLAFVGTRSLEIFLAHIIAAAGARIGLRVLGVEDPAVHIVVGVAVGVGMPILGWWILTKLRFPWLFEAPSFLMGRTITDGAAPRRRRSHSAARSARRIS